MQQEQGAEADAAGSRWIERIAAGDRAAEAAFVETFRRGVLAMVRRHCRPREPAVEDIAHDVLIAVLGKLRKGGVRDEGALPAYLRSAVVFAVQAEYRKRGRREALVQGAAEDSGKEPSDAVPAEQRPFDHLAQAQRRSAVHALLAELGVPRDREVLRRFYLQEEDRKAICTALGIDEGHFRKVLFRARSRFAELWQQHQAGDAA